MFLYKVTPSGNVLSQTSTNQKFLILSFQKTCNNKETSRFISYLLAALVENALRSQNFFKLGQYQGWDGSDF